MDVKEIKDKLREFNISQRQLSIATGLSQSQISLYLKGRSIPGPSNTRKIEEVLIAACVPKAKPIPARDAVRVPRNLPNVYVKAVLVEFQDGTRGMWGKSRWGRKAIELEV